MIFLIEKIHILIIFQLIIMFIQSINQIMLKKNLIENKRIKFKKITLYKVNKIFIRNKIKTVFLKVKIKKMINHISIFR
jgi:hypothetical protein